MIGFTLDPGASGVSIAGVEVWKPESLSPAAAAAVTVSAAPRASADKISRFNLPPSPGEDLVTAMF
jgi:hypothetical protein